MIFPIQHEGISKIETYSRNDLINVLVISTSSDVFEHMKKELNRINDMHGYRINFNEERFEFENLWNKILNQFHGVLLCLP